MSEPSDPVPRTPSEPSTPPSPAAGRPRIGDADRDQAVGFLQEHLAQGRLDAGEFDERMTQALQAKTAADLDPLFTDLPEPRPATGTVATYAAPPWQSGTSVAPPPTPTPTEVSQPEARTNTALATVTAVMWPATILVITLLLGWPHFWWLIFVPVIISSILGKDSSDRRERERSRIAREQRRLDQRRRAIGD